MGSTEAVLRNLEVLSMQMRCQAEFAASGLEIAQGAIAHWQGVADGFRSDCAEAMQARASAETFRSAEKIFAELLAACQRAGGDAEAVLGE
jgi:conjugal transfer/entry exclusion protein